MHHFIFPTQDTWISSGSSIETGLSLKDKNFGQDEILELKKEFDTNIFEYQTRVLINFAGTDFNNLKSQVDDGTIPSTAKYYLRLYEAEGNKELSTDYDLVAFPLHQAWEEGSGKFEDNPKSEIGTSWENRLSEVGMTSLSWSLKDAAIDAQIPGDEDVNGIEFNEYHTLFSNADQIFSDVTGSYLAGHEGGGVWIQKRGFASSQSFSSQSPDVDMDVTDMVNKWINEEISNYGVLLRFSGSQETDETTFGHLKFFSRQSPTIYSPRLEVRWNDHIQDTGSLTQLTMSGLADNYLEIRNLKNNYRKDEKVKFRINARKRYIDKSIRTEKETTTSVVNSYIPAGKSFYAIKDVATDEFIVPFSSYTSMSCDEESPYFIQWLDGFHEDRTYKILLKLKYTDGQEQVFDDDFKFVIREGI
tara:strand:+ start:12641 stop:13891 length:1251 start_codon:yes stop_codon:yes gene_type:complete